MATTEEKLRRAMPLCAVAASLGRLSAHCEFIEETIKRLGAIGDRDGEAFDRLVDAAEFVRIAATLEELAKIVAPITEVLRSLDVPAIPRGGN